MAKAKLNLSKYRFHINFAALLLMKIPMQDRKSVLVYSKMILPVENADRELGVKKPVRSFGENWHGEKEKN